MGFNISAIVPRKAISFKELKGKSIAIDAFIELYQFLKTMPRLTDRKGRLTSHLVGLFYRTTRLMSIGIKPVFVFDGPWLEIGKHERIVRGEFQPRVTETVSEHVLLSSKQLLEGLGVPWLQAPSEAEAQAAFMTTRGDCWAVASQDFDSLLFGAKRMIVNFSLAKRRWLPRKKGFVLTGTYLIELKELLQQLGIDQKQLIALAMLIGTDFNPGIHGIGPKKGLKLVKQYGNDFDKLFRDAGWNFEYSWQEVFEHIKTMPITDRYKIKWKDINEPAILELLVEGYGFDKKRVLKALERARTGWKKK
ncbi:MAG: flap structure-specific endonuclease [Candidatus Woesearchaeota archaeon]